MRYRYRYVLCRVAIWDNLAVGPNLWRSRQNGQRIFLVPQGALQDIAEVAEHAVMGRQTRAAVDVIERNSW